MSLRDAMTTGEVADHINMVLGAKVYDDRAIRAEVDAKRLRAIEIGGGTRYRRRLRVTPDDFLRWATQVLHDEEVIKLRTALAS
jgi:hypothetical protein